MRLSARSPFSSGAYVSGSSPPSPELERAPIRFMPIAKVRCASGESAPKDMAVEMKRRRRSEEHTSELQSRFDLVCRLLLEKKKKKKKKHMITQKKQNEKYH